MLTIATSFLALMLAAHLKWAVMPERAELPRPKVVAVLIRKMRFW